MFGWEDVDEGKCSQGVVFLFNLVAKLNSISIPYVQNQLFEILRVCLYRMLKQLNS